MTGPTIERVAVTLLPCPFPHEVKLGVFLDIDEEDFGIVRGACSDCGACGPYVVIDGDRVRSTEVGEAARLWNTRISASSGMEEIVGALEQIATDAPLERPDGPYDQMGGYASDNFGDVIELTREEEAWRCAEIARAALARIRGSEKDV